MSVPTVFVSHAHRDKSIARRVARRLAVYGVKAWLDERELRIGITLTAAIRRHIGEADVLLVIASQAAAESDWVGQELNFAREHGKPIIPLFIEPVAAQQRFRDLLGVDASRPQAFADVLDHLISDLFQSLDCEVPARDPAVLTEGLRELARQEPDLAPLTLGCLDGPGLSNEHFGMVGNVALLALDEAVNALFDLRPDTTMAYHVAHAFRERGIGVRALSAWIKATGDGGLPLGQAVGSTLDAAHLPSAIELLARCDPPNNSAIYAFIHCNAAQFDASQRRAVIGLAVWPIRVNVERFADVLGWVAFKAFPEAPELQKMWVRWIAEGAFDHKARLLASYLHDAHQENLPGWEPVNESLRSHVRGLLRSRDKDRVVLAMDHIQATADAGAPVLAALLREATGVSGTAEWNDWRLADPKTAESMEWRVFAYAQQAAGARDWLHAEQSAEEMTKYSHERRRLLAEGARPPSEDG